MVADGEMALIQNQNLFSTEHDIIVITASTADIQDKAPTNSHKKQHPVGRVRSVPDGCDGDRGSACADHRALSERCALKRCQTIKEPPLSSK